MENNGNASRNRRNELQSGNTTLLIPKVTKEMVELARRMSDEGKSREEIERAIAQMGAKQAASQSGGFDAANLAASRKSKRAEEDVSATVMMPRVNPNTRPPIMPPEIASYPYRQTEEKPQTEQANPESDNAVEETSDTTGFMQQLKIRKEERKKQADEARLAARKEKLKRSRDEAAADLVEDIRSDHIWLNNPLMVRGQFLAPAVVAAFNCETAWMLCVAAALQLILTRLAAALLLQLNGGKRKITVYVCCAAVVYIPVYCLLYAVFGANLATLGIYLPLLAVEPAVIKRMEYSETESVKLAFHRSVSNIIGIVIATMLVGMLRELLGQGSLFGIQLQKSALLPMASQPTGGFILVGVMAAVWTAIANAAVRYRQEEVRRMYGKRK